MSFIHKWWFKLIILALAVIIIYWASIEVRKWASNKFLKPELITNFNHSIKCFDTKDYPLICSGPFEKNINNYIFGEKGPIWLKKHSIAKDDKGNIWTRLDPDDNKPCETGYCWIKK